MNLTEIVRFKSRAEAQAGLALREGDAAGLAFYADEDRIHVGSDDTIIDMVYQRWAQTTPAQTTLMLAPTNPIVAQLNERARLDRLVALAVTSERISAGDLREVALATGARLGWRHVATRRNNAAYESPAGGLRPQRIPLAR